MRLGVLNRTDTILQQGRAKAPSSGLLFKSGFPSGTALLSTKGDQTRDIQQGRCYDFNGVDNRVNVPTALDNQILLASGEVLKFTGYFKYDTDGKWILSRGGQNGGFAMLVSTAKLQIRIIQGGSTATHIQYTGSTALSIGETYYFEAEFSLTACTMSIDGVDQTIASTGPTGSYAEGTQIFSIGALHNGTTNPWDSHLFSIRGYVDGVEKFFYKMDEQSGSIAYDSSGNGYHGTLVNSPTHETQDVYSWQNQVGYSKYTFFSGSQRVTFDSNIALSGDFEINFGFIARSDLTNRSLLGDSSNIFVYLDGSSNLRGIFGVFHSATIVNSQVYDVKIRRVGSTITTTLNGVDDTLSTASTLNLGGVSEGVAGDLIGSVWGLTVDIGNTGELDHSWDNLTWTDSVGGNNGTPSSTLSQRFIPRDESDTANDVFGETLQYSGVAKLNGKLEASNCIDFNGSTQYVDFDSISAISTPLSFSGYINADTVHNGTIFSVADPTIGTKILGLTVTDDGGNLKLRLFNLDTSLETNLSTTILTAGQWYKVVGVFGATNNKIYIDGTKEVDVARTQAISSDLTKPAIGRFSDSSPTQYFNGKIANIQFFEKELSDAEVTTLCEGGSVSGATIATPLAEGSSITVFDVSGNDNDGTLINSPTWSTQDAYAYNFNTGFNKYMYFDGADYVNVTGMTATGDYFGACTISCNVYVENPSATIIVWSLGGAAYRLYTASSSWSINAQSTGVSATEGWHSVSVEYDSSGSAISFTLDGVEEWTGSFTPSTSGTVFNVGARNGGLPWQGIISDFAITGSSVKNFAFDGYGATDADWVDTTGGGNDGTVVGTTPIAIRVPAIGSVDANGETLRNLPVAGHNDAETTVDFKNIAVGDTVPPELAHLAASTNFTAFVFDADTGWDTYDYAFYRQANSIKNDRFLIYDAALTGTELAKANTYTGN